MSKLFFAGSAFVALTIGGLWTVSESAHAGQAIDAVATARLLAGTIDIHVHSAPDNVPRSIDGLDVAKLARSRGMRGIVLKNHYEPTASLAFLARKEAPGL